MGGAAHGECWCSSLRVRGGGWVTMNSPGVQISIAEGVREIVRDPTPRRFFFFLFYFYIMYSLFTVQEHACSASYGVKKTSISKTK